MDPKNWNDWKNVANPNPKVAQQIYILLESLPTEDADTFLKGAYQNGWAVGRFVRMLEARQHDTSKIREAMGEDSETPSRVITPPPPANVTASPPAQPVQSVSVRPVEKKPEAVAPKTPQGGRFSFLKNLVDKAQRPQAQPSSSNPRPATSSGARPGVAGGNKKVITGLVIGGVILILLIAFAAFSSFSGGGGLSRNSAKGGFSPAEGSQPNNSNNNQPEVNVPDLPTLPPLSAALSLATMVIFLTQVVSFLEAYSRGERTLLDWWIVPVTLVVLIFRDTFSGDWWIVFITACTLLLGISIFNNESEEGGRFAFIDLTPMASLTGTLLVLNYAQMAGLPYPAYLPIWVVWLAFVLSMFREMSRTIGLALLAIVAGVISAFTLNPWVITISFLIMITAVNVFAKQGWVHTSKRGQEVATGMKLGGRDLRLIVPWDNVLFAIWTFTFISLALYGNFVIFSFVR